MRQKSMYKCMIRYNGFPPGELLCLQLSLNILVFNQINFPVASKHPQYTLITATQTISRVIQVGSENVSVSVKRRLTL